MKRLIERYPAIVLTILGLVAALAVKYIPGMAGLDTGELTDFLALAVSVLVGVEIHRRVTPTNGDDKSTTDKTP